MSGSDHICRRGCLGFCFTGDLLFAVSKGRFVLFADDGIIFVTEWISEDLRLDPESVNMEFSKWCETNRLMLNNEKTECLFYK